jgi:hypothetical protein
MNFEFLGKIRDVVSFDRNMTPDSLMDGAFRISFQSPVTVTRIQLSGPRGWDTDSSNPNSWVLGVSSTVTSPLLNSSSGSINATGTSFVMYAAEDPARGWFEPFQQYNIHVTFSNGSGSGWLIIQNATPPPPPPPPPLLGDLNNDCIVNSLDWSIMNNRWFTNDPVADINHDGIVNTIDFSMLNQRWFQTCT